MEKDKINTKALCLFHKDGKVLAAKGFDKVKGQNFYRVVGGTVNFFETGEAGVRREIMEEFQSEIENLKFISVVENLFTYEGEKAHQNIFFYTGDLMRKELYEQNPIHVVEETYEFDAEWVPIEDVISGKIILYPELDYKNILENL